MGEFVIGLIGWLAGSMLFWLGTQSFYEVWQAIRDEKPTDRPFGYVVRVTTHGAGMVLFGLGFLLILIGGPIILLIT